MISVMPVLLLAAHPRECNQQSRTRYVPSVCACRWTCRAHLHRRLGKLSEGIVSQLRKCAVPIYPVNKLLYILCLLFLFMYLLLQTFELDFEVFLFLGAVLA